MIPYSKQFIDQKDIKMVVNSLRGKFITQGPKVEEFEKICKIVKCKYAVAVSSCSAGLHIASIASGLKRGSTMLTTPNTFAQPLIAHYIVEQKLNFLILILTLEIFA